MLGGYVIWQRLREQETRAIAPIYVPAAQPSQYDKLAALTPATAQNQSNPWADILSVGIDVGLEAIVNRTERSSGTSSGTFWDKLLGRTNGGQGAQSPAQGGTTTQQAATLPKNTGGVAGVDFATYERREGLPAGYLHRTAQIESGLNPNAKNPRSSAGGLFQFIDSTARQYGLSDRYDPTQATDAASRLAADNAAYLRRKLGREPTAAELYLAHQQGAGGAAKLLRDPNRPATDVVSSAAIRLNGGNTDMTAGQFAGLWINKFNKGYS
ncbi:lytic transglycosylase domain-containing protein [Pseudohalocynthiibacter aestuariivivens]|nr:lytic transglycosylase domain-containing protein [Pseudohalocynthiibacter aestuariivivens]